MQPTIKGCVQLNIKDRIALFVLCDVSPVEFWIYSTDELAEVTLQLKNATSRSMVAIS